MTKLDKRGQALVEFSILSISLVFGLVETAKIFWREWIRFQCVYRVFEATHARVTRGPPHRSPFQVRYSVVFEDDGEKVRGRAVCGSFTETVELPHLEGAKW